MVLVVGKNHEEQDDNFQVLAKKKTITMEFWKKTKKRKTTTLGTLKKTMKKKTITLRFQPGRRRPHPWSFRKNHEK
jgi:hypothetical protein